MLPSSTASQEGFVVGVGPIDAAVMAHHANPAIPHHCNLGDPTVPPLVTVTALVAALVTIMIAAIAGTATVKGSGHTARLEQGVT